MNHMTSTNLFCSQCGKQQASSAKFCNACGQALEPSPTQETEKTDPKVIRKEKPKKPRKLGVKIAGLIALILVIGIGGIFVNEQLKRHYVFTASDKDFSGNANGEFKYIGPDGGYVKIPSVIKGVEVTSYREMFADSYVNGVKSTNKNVTDMSHMFAKAKAKNAGLDLSQLDTSNVTDMSYMFHEAAISEMDLSSFDTSNVTNMESMFSFTKLLTLDLSSFDTSNVTTMANMFEYNMAQSLDLSHFDTSQVENMQDMFQTSQATDLDVSQFDTTNVTNMQRMFQRSEANVLDLSSFDFSNVHVENSTPLGYLHMFEEAKATEGYTKDAMSAQLLNKYGDTSDDLTFVAKPE